MSRESSGNGKKSSIRDYFKGRVSKLADILEIDCKAKSRQEGLPGLGSRGWVKSGITYSISRQKEEQVGVGIVWKETKGSTSDILS